MNKPELRKIYLERRKLLSPDEHSQLSREIVERLFSEVSFSSINTLHCYISLRHFGEVETNILFDQIWSSFPHIITCAPRINAAGDVDSLIYQFDTPLNENRWKIPEPAGSEMVAPEALELVIVPLLCFDLAGHRVGYGKGFYDRLLQECRPDCIKAGLSFFPPVDFIDDIHAGDVSMDICITPSDAHRFTLP